ncbi:MAG: type IV pilus assembly protein PilO [Porticoccaceae bacterium]|jgi:type IV pilus assembly protein PilO|tara:strand:- start:707 stop:1318 length:612 start_codon:yes stop_codon:yes gene_type:complete
MNKATITLPPVLFTEDSIDFSDVATWGKPAIIGASLAVFLVVFFIGYYFLIGNKLQDLDAQVDLQAVKIKEFGEKYALASNKETYQTQMIELDLMFASFLEQIPADTEVPEIIEDVTKIAAQSGLVTSTISLDSAVDLGVYYALPINVTVEGDYHDLGEFVAGLTQLKRLISLHDFSLEKTVNGDLKLNLAAKTFQFNNQENR